jgi:hypothetical protein
MSIEPECKPLPMSQKMSQNLLRIAYVCLWLLKRKPAAIPGKVARPAGLEPTTHGLVRIPSPPHTSNEALFRLSRRFITGKPVHQNNYLIALPASPSHHQSQLSPGQHPSTGRGISGGVLWLWLCRSQFLFNFQ